MLSAIRAPSRLSRCIHYHAALYNNSVLLPPINYVQRGKQYESDVLRYLCRYFQFNLSLTNTTNDHGIDLIGYNQNKTWKICAQCKYQSNTVSSLQLRELYGSIRNRSDTGNNNVCIVYISTQSYSKQSIDLLHRIDQPMICITLTYTHNKNTGNELLLQRCTLNKHAKLLFPHLRVITNRCNNQLYVQQQQSS